MINIRKSSEVVPTTASSSGSSAVLSPPTRAPFITLEQEFQQCERSLGAGLEKVPSLLLHSTCHAHACAELLTQVNLVDRTCLLLARNDSLKQTVTVKVSFPAMYPMNAAPAFEFAARTTLPVELQAQVKEVRALSVLPSLHASGSLVPSVAPRDGHQAGGGEPAVP